VGGREFEPTLGRFSVLQQAVDIAENGTPLCEIRMSEAEKTCIRAGCINGVDTIDNQQ
jgi:hypothetical protein